MQLGSKSTALLGCIALFGCGRIDYVVLFPNGRDGGVQGDGGGILDGAARDSGAMDGGAMDAGAMDAGPFDAGAQDASLTCDDAAMPCSCLGQTPGADHSCGVSGGQDCCASFEIPTESFDRDGNTMYHRGGERLPVGRVPRHGGTVSRVRRGVRRGLGSRPGVR